MLQLRVAAIKRQAPNTATFFLREVNGQKIKYLAGQFLTLIFSHHGQELRRSYSLSSSPDEDVLAITVKRIANGEISRFMLAKVHEGDVLNAIAPAGKFTIENFPEQKDIFLFAAGSGIVPFFSQLKFVLARPGLSRVTLFYSNTDKANILFKEELEALQVKHPGRLTIIHLLSSEGRRLNNITVEPLVKQNLHFDLKNAQFLLCGPFTYMRMVRLTLLFMGVKAAKIRKENFVLDTVTVAHKTLNYPPQSIRLEFNGHLYDIAAGENQSILQAALQNNIALPYSCRAGMCSTCVAKCISGRVEMTTNDVLTDGDIAEGWILTCTGYARDSDVIIKF